MSSADLTAVLAALEPVGRHRVMDLVEEAGASVAAWAVKRGGLPVANPSANPAYCYEWAFGEGGEPVVLCVWHDTLEIDGTRIVYRDNLRRLAMRLDDRANDRREPEKSRSRAKSQAPRARAFDFRCQQGRNGQLPVRLILLKGARADDDDLGRDTSSVDFRRLDSEPWHLAQYDMMTGDFEFVRGAAVDDESASKPVLDVDASPEADPTEADPVKADSTEAQPYVDQFDVVEPPEKRGVQGSSYVRSAQVRAEVLARAAGVCEACGEQGFRMANGAIYLETHHVVPLSQSGPDVKWMTLRKARSASSAKVPGTRLPSGSSAGMPLMKHAPSASQPRVKGSPAGKPGRELMRLMPMRASPDTGLKQHWSLQKSRVHVRRRGHVRAG